MLSIRKKVAIAAVGVVAVVAAGGWFAYTDHSEPALLEESETDSAANRPVLTERKLAGEQDYRSEEGDSIGEGERARVAKLKDIELMRQRLKSLPIRTERTEEDGDNEEEFVFENQDEERAFLEARIAAENARLDVYKKMLAELSSIETRKENDVQGILKMIAESERVLLEYTSRLNRL